MGWFRRVKICGSSAFVKETRVHEFDPMGVATYEHSRIARCGRPTGHSMPHYEESYGFVHKWSDAEAVRP